MAGELYLFVEGSDDERFFLHILVPLLEPKYQKIHMMRYAEDPPKLVRKYLKSINRMGDDYIFTRDLDSSPCVTLCKQRITRKYAAESERIAVVCKEIECWYLGGLDRIAVQKIGIKRVHANTNELTKEDFDAIIPSKPSRMEVMQQIIELYDTEIGKLKNTSFQYFVRKWVV